MSSRYATEQRPLKSYGILAGIFTTGLAVAVVVLGRSRRLPERWETRDLVLAGIATHKLSRLLTKDKVTSFLRAPFTRHQRPSGHGEVEEKPRGSGMRLAIGQLLVCPYCLAQWVGAAFTCGLVFAPRTTRLIASILCAATLSDFLHAAYRATKEQA